MRDHPLAVAFLLAVATLLSCSSSGDPSIARVVRSPSAIPFGTAGLSSIPPRPSYSPSYHGGAVPASPPPVSWATREQALDGVAAYRPSWSRDAIALPPQFFAPYGACAGLGLPVLGDDGDALRRAALDAVGAMGLEVTFVDRRPLDHPFDTILLAETPQLRLIVEAGRFDPATWPDARAAQVSRTYVIRALFWQRCSG